MALSLALHTMAHVHVPMSETGLVYASEDDVCHNPRCLSHSMFSLAIIAHLCNVIVLHPCFESPRYTSAHVHVPMSETGLVLASNEDVYHNPMCVS